MPLERLTLVSLLMTVAVVGCADAGETLGPSIGDPVGPLDSTNAPPGGGRGDERVIWGPAAPILPRGARFTVLRGDPAKPPKSPSK